MNYQTVSEKQRSVLLTMLNGTEMTSKDFRNVQDVLEYMIGNGREELIQEIKRLICEYYIRDFKNKDVLADTVENIIVTEGQHRISVVIHTRRPGYLIGYHGRLHNEIVEMLEKKFSFPVELRYLELTFNPKDYVKHFHF